jgi:hypothetical protein
VDAGRLEALVGGEEVGDIGVGVGDVVDSDLAAVVGAAAVG